jgi:murein DD-endopeptidase MepM/ murein hydrolase activator NlpD
MTPAIVRIGERIRRWRAELAAWARGKKTRFADLRALRRGNLPRAASHVLLRRQLAIVAAGSLCIFAYSIVLIAVTRNRPVEIVVVAERESPHADTIEAEPAPVVAAAELNFDIDGMIGMRESAITQAIADRAEASLDRDRALAERDQALAERDAVIAADREVLVDLHARTSRTIATIEGILAATGVDPGHVLKASGKADAARPRGGPFVPWSERAVRDSGGDSRRLASLTWGVERLAVLRDVLAHMPLASPLAELQIFDGFGYRHDPFTGRDALHEGVDLRGTTATQVMATADGVVSFAGWHSDYGNLVEIDHGYGLTTRYAHLSRILVRTGAPVTLRERIGIVGGTGRVTAVHLHYEVRVDGRARNPVNFLKAGHHVPEADHVVAQEISFGPDAFAGFDSGQGASYLGSAVDHQR